jgi:hypothetical protein
MIRALVALGGVVFAACAGKPATGVNGPGAVPSELAIEVAGDKIMMGEQELADAAALQKALMETSSSSTVVSVKTQGAINEAALWGVLREVSKAPAGRIDLKLGDVVFSVSSRLVQEPPSPESKWVFGNVDQGGLTLRAGSELLAEVPIGDAAAEARGRAAVETACAAADCRGGLSISNEVPLLPTLRAWHQVYGDRKQTLSLNRAVQSAPSEAGDRTAVSGVSGRIPPEVIQRIVRENFYKFRICYEAGLARNDRLQGIIEARFVITLEGTVIHVEDEGSNLPDAEVRECVFKTFRDLKFPAPEGGIVVVIYPIMLSPN